MKRSVKPEPKERDIQKAILEYLKLKGIFCWRQNTMAQVLHYNGKSRMVRSSMSGVSDILGIINRCWSNDTPSTRAWTIGQFLAIEVKRPGEKPTLDQHAFMQAIKHQGGIAFVATSVEDVQKELGL